MKRSVIKVKVHETKAQSYKFEKNNGPSLFPSNAMSGYVNSYFKFYFLVVRLKISYCFPVNMYTEKRRELWNKLFDPDTYIHTGDFMKKVLTTTCALKDRYIVSIERVYTPSTFYMKSAVCEKGPIKKETFLWDGL